MNRLGEILSPNISHRSGRESYQSDLVAPSDSISVPGYLDRNRPHDSFKAIRPAVKGRKDCQKCGMSLKGKRYVKRDGIMLCETDWKEMFLPKVSRLRDRLPYDRWLISHSHSAADVPFLSRPLPSLRQTDSSRANGTASVSPVTTVNPLSVGTRSTSSRTDRTVNCIITIASEYRRETISMLGGKADAVISLQWNTMCFIRMQATD
jgi:hypothetical protein